MLADHLTKLKPISNSSNVRKSLFPLLSIPIIYIAYKNTSASFSVE